MAGFGHIFVYLLLARAVSSQGLSSQKRNVLLKRTCDTGESLCGISGRTFYCAPAGYKCCDSRRSAPKDATCCANGKYAEAGYYCCVGSGMCPIGDTCRSCVPERGGGGNTISAVVPSTMLAPLTSTVTRAVTASYTFTITYFYFQAYYIYVPSITRSAITSSIVTTRTTVIVYATDSADAQASFNQISVTALLPTPESATDLPPLPSQTASAATSTTTSRAATVSATISASTTQFSTAISSYKHGEKVHILLVACIMLVMMGVFAVL